MRKFNLESVSIHETSLIIIVDNLMINTSIMIIRRMKASTRSAGEGRLVVPKGGSLRVARPKRAVILGLHKFALVPSAEVHCSLARTEGLQDISPPQHIVLSDY